MAPSSAISCTETSSNSFLFKSLASASHEHAAAALNARIRRLGLGLKKLGHFYIDESIPLTD